MYRKIKIWLLIAFTVVAGLITFAMLIGYVNQVSPTFEFLEKRCISGFVWDSKEGYTGETCQMGFKG